jgi:queuine tRNA-ribosyltransferase
VQGGTFPDLRVKSAEFSASKEADGNAIGGLSVGEPTEDMYSMTSLVCDILPKSKPRYLMGVGKPENILECIERGIDMFDCVMPTRNARHGYIFTTRGIVNIKNEKWKNEFTPLDPILTPEYSMSYTRHLLMSSEYLGFIIASIQNLSFYLWLTKEARKHILEGDFAAWKAYILPIVSKRY